MRISQSLIFILFGNRYPQKKNLLDRERIDTHAINTDENSPQLHEDFVPNFKTDVKFSRQIFFPVFWNSNFRLSLFSYLYFYVIIFVSFFIFILYSDFRIFVSLFLFLYSDFRIFVLIFIFRFQFSYFVYILIYFYFCIFCYEIS